MAWLLWDDNGIEALVSKYEPALYALFKLLPYSVEKADVFRIVVLKWFGGVVSLTATLQHALNRLTVS